MTPQSAHASCFLCLDGENSACDGDGCMGNNAAGDDAAEHVLHGVADNRK
jgi:hypothetical protein